MKFSKVSINGNEYMTTTYKLPNGSYKKIYGRTIEEVEKKLQDCQKKLETFEKGQEAIHFAAREYTLEEYMTAFPFYEQAQKSKILLHNAFNFHTICKHLKQKKLYQITETDIHHFLHVIETGYTWNTIKTIEQYCILLFQTYYQDYSNHKFSYQPIEIIEMDGAEKSIYIPNLSFFTAIKEHALESFAENENKAYLVLYLVCVTGLPISEILQVVSSDVDIERNSIKISNLDYRIEQPDFFPALLTDVKTKHDFCFLNANKNMLARESIAYALSSLIDNYGLPDKITINNLRQAYVIHVLMKTEQSISEDEIKSCTRLSKNSIQELLIWLQNEKIFRKKYNLELAGKLLLDRKYKDIIKNIIEVAEQ